MRGHGATVDRPRAQMDRGRDERSHRGPGSIRRERPARRALAGLRCGPGLREVLVFAAALLAYQASRALVIGDAASALDHARDIVALERSAGLFVESALQSWALETGSLVEGLNLAYLALHLPVTAAFFVWLFRTRRSLYGPVRTMFLVMNAIALVVFVIYPAAPPRLLEGVGMVDTLNVVSDVDLHGGRLSGWFNPYAAVPSMHFGYALVAGLVTLAVARRRLLRVAGLAYPALVLVTITATANHYVVDAAAAALVAGIAAAAVWGARRLPRRGPQPLGPGTAPSRAG